MDILVIQELERIASENGGLLQPVKVVEAAMVETSPLHSRFTWDDTKAAYEYRLSQARQLISVAVKILPGNTGSPERIFVSLRGDREQPNGGYRFLTSVLSDAQMRAQLVAEALEEMEYFMEKYSHLKELAEIFDAMAKISSKRTRPVAQGKAQLRA